MTPVWIAVAVLAAFGLAVMVCIMFAVSWYAIMQMRKMQQAATEIVDSIAEFMGDGSITRLSKAVPAITGELPELVQSLKGFSKSVESLHKLLFVPDRGGKTSPPPVDTDSNFYGYSEQQAADNEKSARAAAETLDLSPEVLAGMRTENQAMPPKEFLPPRPDEVKSA